MGDPAAQRCLRSVVEQVARFIPFKTVTYFAELNPDEEIVLYAATYL